MGTGSRREGLSACSTLIGFWIEQQGCPFADAGNPFAAQKVLLIAEVANHEQRRFTVTADQRGDRSRCVTRRRYQNQGAVAEQVVRAIERPEWLALSWREVQQAPGRAGQVDAAALQSLPRKRWVSVSCLPMVKRASLR